MSLNKFVTTLSQQNNTKYKQSKDVPFDISKTKIYPQNLDILKRWIVVYYIYNSDLNKLERKFIAVSSKDYKTFKARNQYAINKIYEINKILRAGFYIGKTDFNNNGVGALSVSVALYKILELNQNKYKERTKETLKTPVRHFANYCNDIDKNLLISEIEKSHVLGFIDYLLIKENLSNRTINNYLGYLAALFSDMLERDWIKENNFLKVKKLKAENTTTNRALSDSEVNILLLELKKPSNYALF